MADAKMIAGIFKCLAVEARVRIVQLLNEHSFCVNALAARLNMTQGAVSQHLRILRDAGLIVPEKRGYWVHYQLNRPLMEEWLGLASGLLKTDRVFLPCLSSEKKEQKE
ncbi:MAG: metalloregulator ArsR/SmtB family transcription factor [Pseudomonadota bacterium]